MTGEPQPVRPTFFDQDADGVRHEITGGQGSFFDVPVEQVAEVKPYAQIPGAEDLDLQRETLRQAALRTRGEKDVARRALEDDAHAERLATMGLDHLVRHRRAS